ncbi:hypothetical protein Csa_014847 [Cucumis sativus]|uniref:Acetate kinase n=1 Tax=Cucumis sativus TaxID=3659 RepID=A0A0A0KW14_CUCSA|nr:hypothetical protein Csa_014847 [Cucumis sativus]
MSNNSVATVVPNDREDCKQISNVEYNEYLQAMGKFAVEEHTHNMSGIERKFISVGFAVVCSVPVGGDKYHLLVKVDEFILAPSFPKYEKLYMATVLHNKVNHSWALLRFENVAPPTVYPPSIDYLDA